MNQLVERGSEAARKRRYRRRVWCIDDNGRPSFTLFAEIHAGGTDVMVSKWMRAAMPASSERSLVAHGPEDEEGLEGEFEPVGIICSPAW
jgi:hypothetical protein